MKIFYANAPISEVRSFTLMLLPDHYGKPFTYLWDDFGYKTTFRGFFLSGKYKVDLGNIKILFKDNFNSHEYIQNKFPCIDGVYDVSNISNHDFISIGEDIDYYNIINSEKENRREVKQYLKALNDVCLLSLSRDDFQRWEGYKLSLLRDSSLTSVLSKGLKTALGSYEELSSFSLNINQDKGHSLNLLFNKKTLVPSRINILIGKNGCGKTRTLNYISNIYTGVISSFNEWPYCNKLITASFSPFDNFPTDKELHLKLNTNNQDSTDYINGYSYIGFKDDSSSFNLESFIKRSVKSYINSIRLDETRRVRKDFNRISLIHDTLRKAMSFEQIGLKSSNDQIILHDQYDETDDIDEAYGLVFLDEELNEIKLSSGQRMYSLFVPSIISEIKKESLLLIDEPELYLHPELEVGLISMLKKVLSETNSFAIIATHSAIIAREIQSDFVHILENNFSCRKPDIETLGNSLERISADVFGDKLTDKPYQEILDDLIDTRYLGNIDKAIDELSDELGSKGISYLYAKKKK